jgi:hypothetical protein
MGSSPAQGRETAQIVPASLPVRTRFERGLHTASFCFRSSRPDTGTGNLVKSCGRRGCQRLFLPERSGAGRPQRYCSRGCSQRARFERFRDTLTPEQWREKRHQDYVKKIAKKKGRVPHGKCDATLRKRAE